MDFTYSSDSENDNDNMETESGGDTSCSSNASPPVAGLTMDDIDEYNPYSPRNNTKDKPSTITALLEAYGSLSVPQLLALLAPNFTHCVLPESLGMPVRDKEAFAQHAAGIFAIFESFRMEPKDGVLKMEGRRETWVVRAHMSGVLKGGKGEWKNECVLIVRMDDEGALVEEIQEFVDSAKALEMLRAHAPNSFGAEGQGKTTRMEVDATPAVPLFTTFCWFLFCVLVAKLGAHVLALVMFWGHPRLEALRRSVLLTPIKPRL